MLTSRINSGEYGETKRLKYWKYGPKEGRLMIGWEVLQCLRSRTKAIWSTWTVNRGTLKSFYSKVGIIVEVEESKQVGNRHE